MTDFKLLHKRLTKIETLLKELVDAKRAKIDVRQGLVPADLVYEVRLVPGSKDH